MKQRWLPFVAVLFVKNTFATTNVKTFVHVKEWILNHFSSADWAYQTSQSNAGCVSFCVGGRVCLSGC